jgi:hypothetical protein
MGCGVVTRIFPYQEGTSGGCLQSAPTWARPRRACPGDALTFTSNGSDFLSPQAGVAPQYKAIRAASPLPAQAMRLV